MTRDDELTIRRGYPSEAHRVICCDFDGVIAPFGYIDSDPEPLPGAAESLRRLRDHGFRIVILTSRMSPKWLASAGYDAEDMRAKVSSFLDRNDIPFDDITAEKVPAIAYLDDRAIRVASGELPAAVDWILFARNDCE